MSNILELNTQLKNSNELSEKFPCIANKEVVPEASKKYSLIQTDEVIELFNRRGFEVVKDNILASDSKQFGTHVIPFRHKDLSFNQGKFETRAFLRTSHDRKTSFQIIIGALNFVCANGLFSGSQDFKITHKHMGLTMQHIEEVMLEDAIIAMEKKKLAMEWLNNTKVAEQDLKDFVNKVVQLRTGGLKNFYKLTNESMERLLTPQQESFKENSYFNLWNTIDENLFTNGNGQGNKAERVVLEFEKFGSDKTRKLKQITNPKAVIDFKEKMEEWINSYIPNDVYGKTVEEKETELLIA